MCSAASEEAALKRALEWELSLDARDLRSHAWYHGSIPRQRAEEIIQRDGDFLVRDCGSQPGNYVLTCRSRTQPLHFVINRLVVQPDTVYERVQYQFEDDSYDTVPDLITFYVGSGKHVTVASGARIQHPRNRLYPLSFYATRYPTGSRVVSPCAGAPPRYGCATAVHQSPTRVYRDVPPPRLPSKKQRSQSLTPEEASRAASHEKCNSADGVIQSPLMTRSIGGIQDSQLRFSTLPRPLSSSSSANRGPRCMSRVTSDPSLSPCAERRHFPDEERLADSPPPPKPSRIPSVIRSDHDIDRSDGVFIPHGCLQRVASYHASGSDSGNGSGDSAQSSAAGDAIEPNHKTSGVVIKNPRYLVSTSESISTLKNLVFDYVEAERRLMQLPQPDIISQSQFDLENFHTLLLPAIENKPLDAKALRSIKMTLQDTAPRVLANHITRVDLDLVFGEYSSGGLVTGIELCGLPHGHQLRTDLIERTECFKLLVAITILTCTNDVERAEILNKWIEIAIDTKTALGNLYGFCGLMLGLCMPQIQKLDSTWHMLRQKHTESAFFFEAKLKPTLKSMNECSNPQAPNTTIPHILPFVLLQERTLQEFDGGNSDGSTLGLSCLTAWETHAHDFGLGTLLAHLQAARKFTDTLTTFKRNAEIVYGDNSRTEELIMDTFRTEFHMKFLWGSRGAQAEAHDRHYKFEQVLTAMSDKFSGESNNGTPV